MVEISADRAGVTDRPDAPKRRLGIDLVVGVLAILTGGGVLLLGRVGGVDAPILLRDTGASFGTPFYAGLISQLGIWLLVLTAGVTGFAARMSTGRRWLLAAVALFSLCLAADDQFMLHEYVGPFVIGLPSKAVMLGYAILGVGILLAMWRDFLQGRATGLVVAMGLMGLSVVIDLLPMELGTPGYIAEDLAKLGGFAVWTAFWCLFAAACLRRDKRLAQQ